MQMAAQGDPSTFSGQITVTDAQGNKRLLSTKETREAHQRMSGFRKQRDTRARGVVPIPGSQIMGGGATFAGSPYRTYSSTADRLAALPASWSRSKRAQFDIGQATQIQGRQQAFRQRGSKVRLFR